jgi:hypothetical protein
VTPAAGEPAGQAARAAAASPYERVLGPGFAELHPQLRSYFAAVPEGSVGLGHGTFAEAGAPRRWVRAALRALGLAQILFPVWEHDVPFTVLNRAVPGAHGHRAVAAVRTFHLRGGDRVMVDRVDTVAEALVDVLGRDRRVQACFGAAVEDAALKLESTAVAVRVGRRTLRVPGPIAPRIRLTERAGAAGEQHIALTVRLPVLGQIYGYSGTFSYEIRPEDE